MKRMVSRVSGRGIRVACAAAGLSALFAGSAVAQSTIFNIPSTDTVEKSKFYVEFDVLPQAPAPDVGDMITIYNPRVVVGVAPDVEVGVNFPVYHTSANSGYIQPNVKWKFFKNDMGLAASAGGVLNTPLNNREGQGSWGYIYGNISKKWTGDKGPRVTVGPYGVVADQSSGLATFVGTRGGLLVGYEQPLGGPVSFVADWFSGKNTLGYFTPGVSVTLPHSGLLNIGYSIGNDVKDETANYKDRYLFVYYGVTF